MKCIIHTISGECISMTVCMDLLVLDNTTLHGLSGKADSTNYIVPLWTAWLKYDSFAFLEGINIWYIDSMVSILSNIFNHISISSWLKLKSNYKNFKPAHKKKWSSTESINSNHTITETKGIKIQHR